VTLLVTDPLYLEHRAPGHVECPERVKVILDHFHTTGLDQRLTPLPARDATIDELALMHGREYIEVVREVSERGGGWFDADTYLNEKSWAAAIRAVGGVLAAVEAVRAGRDRTALCLVRPPGHHALSERGMGFCLFNNVAIAARFLKRRVLIVDWDVHHGNGTQELVEDDPTIWYLSTHRFPFYPGTGWEDEKGAGNIINIPMDGRTSREDFLQRFTTAVRDAASKFKPEFLLVSCGFDAYENDPIGGLNLKPADYRSMTDVVCGYGVPVISALEGGYSLDGLGPCAEQHALGLLAASR
jgi:acetoin utilization deacetylase AcuC-like enzyme